MKKLIIALTLLMAPGLSSALSEGERAPDIKVKNQNGQTVSLSKFKGQYVVLYFYPKDDTPGCTVEANGFKDQYARLKALNAVVLGVSRQDEKSHQEFKSKMSLPFDLLADVDGQAGKAFGVSTIPGKDLSLRESFLIDPTGKIVRHFANVDPNKHTKDVIHELESRLQTN